MSVKVLLFQMVSGGRFSQQMLENDANFVEAMQEWFDEEILSEVNNELHIKK